MLEIKKAILFKETFFHLINFLNTGYWLGEEYLAYYNDSGKYALGDLLGKLILLEDCKKIILEELFQGLYNVEFLIVDVEKSDFNRKSDLSNLKNWIGWTTKHKKFQVVDLYNFNWLKTLKT